VSFFTACFVLYCFAAVTATGAAFAGRPHANASLNSVFRARTHTQNNMFVFSPATSPLYCFTASCFTATK
jgi:hypothetical protein